MMGLGMLVLLFIVSGVVAFLLEWFDEYTNYHARNKRY